MPILLYKNIPTVVSRSEFLHEYKKVESEYETPIDKPQGYCFELAVGAITNLNFRDFDKHPNDGVSRLYRFKFLGKEAQNVVIELLLFFSVFYCKFKIFDKRNCVLKIEDYLLPNRPDYDSNRYLVKIQHNKMCLSIKMDSILTIEGLLNNFVICTDNLLIHFESDVMYGKQIKIISMKYDDYTKWKYELNLCDYVLKRNMPSRLKLWSKRCKGFLVIMQ